MNGSKASHTELSLDELLVIFAKATRIRYGTHAMKRIQRGIAESEKVGDTEAVRLWQRVRGLVLSMDDVI